MNKSRRYHFIWEVFDFLVCRRFGSSIPIDKKTGYADAAAIVSHALQYLRFNAEELYPPVIYETEYCHRDFEWLPYKEVLTGVDREKKFLKEVQWFFEDVCRSDEYTLAGIEEPRTAARKFSRVNYFTLTDEIRIDVKNGDLYTRNRATGGWTLIYSDLLICPSESPFENLING